MGGEGICEIMPSSTDEKLKFLFFRFDIMKKDRERLFFGLYKDRGVADLCVQALIAKYDLDIFMKENQGFDDEVKTILYKEAHKAIDENATIMDVDFDALFDEIEANLHEVAGDKKQRDDSYGNRVFIVHGDCEEYANEMEKMINVYFFG